MQRADVLREREPEVQSRRKVGEHAARALLRGLDPYAAVTAAVAVGACSVEAPDALSGVRSWEDTLERIAGEWERLPLQVTAQGWDWNEREQLWEKRSR